MSRIYDWETQQMRRFPFLSHEEIVRQLVADLEAQGERPQTGMALPSGYPDIVTEGQIYEIKPKLTVQAMQKAIGQLVLYGADLPGRELVIVGYAEEAVKFQSHCESLGIKVIVYKNDTWKHNKERDETYKAHCQSLSPRRPTRVRSLRRPKTRVQGSHESWEYVYGVLAALVVGFLVGAYGLDWLTQIFGI